MTVVVNVLPFSSVSSTLRSFVHRLSYEFTSSQEWNATKQTKASEQPKRIWKFQFANIFVIFPFLSFICARFTFDTFMIVYFVMGNSWHLKLRFHLLFAVNFHMADWEIFFCFISLKIWLPFSSTQRKTFLRILLNRKIKCDSSCFGCVRNTTRMNRLTHVNMNEWKA